MSSGTDRARELLKFAEGLELNYCDFLDLAIKQHEALRGEHLYSLRTDSPYHQEAVRRSAYERYKDTCPECLVLLQWEQMWEEE